MKMHKKTSVAGEWAKVGEDINNGDIVTILDEGTVVNGEYGEQEVFKVKTANGDEKNMRFNQKTVNNLIDAFGDESTEWVNKQVEAFVVKAMVSGKMRNIVYLAPKGWVMDDEGNFAPRGNSDTERSTEAIDPDTDVPF